VAALRLQLEEADHKAVLLEEEVAALQQELATAKVGPWASRVWGFSLVLGFKGLSFI
jgi:hypothetical protein